MSRCTLSCNRPSRKDWRFAWSHAILPADMPVANKLNEPVLILNVNYEPLHVCNTRRALALVFQRKAEIILNGRGTIRSASAEFDIPSVIKLGYMVRRPRLQIRLTKREILRRDDYTCQYCGRKTHLLTIDHVVPRRLGGVHIWTNVVTACPPCNRRKGGKTPDNANMMLRRQPFQPNSSAYYRFGHHLSTHSEWEQFILGW
jgi:5-methylcytosine-specific restriction endonuclease McrA